MSKLLMESLKLDMPALAKLIQARGRKGDTILAHISPKEAALLKKRGGAGTKNPDTGLPEYAEDGGFDVSSYFGAADQPAVQSTFTPAQTSTGQDVTSFQAPSADYSYAPATQAQIGQQLSQGYQAPGEAFNPQEIAAGTQRAPGPFETVSPRQLDAARETLGLSTLAQPNLTQPPQSFLDKLTTSLSDPEKLARMGLVGGLGVLGTQRAKQAAAQNQAAQAEQAALGAPYQQMGNQMVAQGQAGELTPSSQAAYQAAQARLNQDIATRGGVGVQQAANQSAALYSQLLQNQTQYGLQVAGIGDSYQINAIQTGLALDQQTNQNLQNYYAALAAVAFGIPMRTTTP
jgi:hypothetical protein